MTVNLFPPSVTNGGNTEVTLEAGPLLTVIAKQDKTSG